MPILVIIVAGRLAEASAIAQSQIAERLDSSGDGAILRDDLDGIDLRCADDVLFEPQSDEALSARAPPQHLDDAVAAAEQLPMLRSRLAQVEMDVRELA